ncbi:hypothetical protein HETIRDRAFT_242504, partial [Heterobasidion irregulare TC 32-1]
AQNWHTVEWDATEFTALSGDMLVPSLPPPGGTPYVWPGLQPGTAGVLQAVLDGRSGSWWIGDGYYGTPSLPWGAGFNAAPGETVHFTFALGSNDTWTCTLSSSSGASASTTLAIAGQTMNRRVPHTAAILAVELYDIAYTFGPTIYRNLVLTATTAASGWCGKTVSSGYTSGQYTVTGATASGNTCRVAEVIMPSA